MATEAAPSIRAADDRPGTQTVAALWRDAVAQRRAHPAYLVESEDGWHEVSWSEAAMRVDELANGLLALGVGKGDAFTILSRTRIEWALLDFALAQIGAVVVPIYPTDSPAQCAYILDNSDSIGIVVEDEGQLAKIEEVRADLPRLEHVLTFADLDDLAQRGRNHAREHPRALEEAALGVAEDDLATCIYTSGTTGPPKGCLVTHRQRYVRTAMVEELPDFMEPDDLMLLYLPLAHSFGRLMVACGAYHGYTIAFCPDIQRITEAIGQVRPTLFPSVPRVYEKVHTAVQAQFAQATGMKRRLIDWSLATGQRVSRLKQEGKPVPPGLALRYRLADRLVFSKVRAKLGGRLRLGISSGAPLAREIAEYFHALDVLILEGYGMTECLPVAVNRPDRFRFGTIGPPLSMNEVRIADDGELLFRGPNVFQGYHKNEQATREVFTEDGWLRSGDVGEFDEDGFLKITDRKKDILITAGGMNVAPQNIENALKISPHISQALVVGDGRKYVAALISLDEDEIRKWARGRGLDGDLATLADNDQVRQLIQEVVDSVNASLARVEQLKRFRILPRDFSMEAGELTPTLKLKRRVVQDRFADEIEQLYA
jgi:long-chain acyl-CoA synthetase